MFESFCLCVNLLFMIMVSIFMMFHRKSPLLLELWFLFGFNFRGLEFELRTFLKFVLFLDLLGLNLGLAFIPFKFGVSDEILEEKTLSYLFDADQILKVGIQGYATILNFSWIVIRSTKPACFGESW